MAGKDKNETAGKQGRPGALLRLLAFAVLLAIGGKLLWNHTQLISCPMPLEYREAHIPATTHLLLEGVNPFALEQQPAFTNVYGITFSYICYPVVALFGESYAVYRSVAAFFIWMCCGLLFMWLRREGVNRLMALAGSLIFYASLLYFVTPMVRPDSFGLFLFMLALYLPSAREYRIGSLIISALCVIVAFFAKTYFLLAAPFLAAHLFLFRSKKTGLLYGILFLGLFVLSARMINAWYETYFSNVFFIYTNYKIDDPAYLLLQCKEYLKHSGGLVTLSLIAVFLFWRNRQKNRLKVDIVKSNHPLLSQSMPLPVFVVLLVLFLFAYRMGQHKGAWLTYLFQLVTPFLLLSALPVIQKYLAVFLIRPIAGLLLLVNLYMASFPFLSRTDEVRDGISQWNLLLSLVKPAQHVLNTPIIALERLKDGRKVYDTGNSEYFQYGGDRKGIWAWMSDPQEAITEQWLHYRDSVQAAIQNRAFDLVAIGRGPRFMMDETLLARHYTLLITIPVHMPHATMHSNEQRFDIGVWEAKGRERPVAEKYALFQQLYACDPNDFFISYYIGFQLFEVMGDYKNAVRFLEMAANLKPDIPIVHNALGSIYFNHLQDYPNALRHFQSAHALVPSDAAIRTNLGYTYRMMGDEANAARYLGRGP